MNAIETIEQERLTRQEQEHTLLIAVSDLLLPLVSPYDLSVTQRINQYQNNPYFNRAVKEITFRLINK